jgi:RNA polymerase sigma factor (sigma-70 family)
MHTTTTEPRASVAELATQIFEQRREHLLSIARRHGGRGIDPEDSLQEALALFCAHYDPEGDAHPVAWITLTLKRLCWASYGRRNLETRIGTRPGGLGAPDLPSWREPASSASTEAVAEATLEARELGRHMARLKPDERRALSMIAFGYSYREIGERNGWTYRKVNLCLAEGRAALRVG